MEALITGSKGPIIPDVNTNKMNRGNMIRLWGIGRISTLSFLLISSLSSCVTRHSVTLHSDRSAFVSSVGTFQNTSHKWDRRSYYDAEVIRDVDTSQIHGLGQGHHFIINDLDSLGNHLATFNPGHIVFSLQNEELVIRSQNGIPLRKGWSRCDLTLYIEQGIKGVHSSNKVRHIGPNIISLKIPRRLLEKRQNAIDIRVLLRPEEP